MSQEYRPARKLGSARAVVGASGGKRVRRKMAEPPQETAAVMTERQRGLYAAVCLRSSHVKEQLALLVTLSRCHGASTVDIQIVRDRLLAGVSRECEG